MVRIRVDNRQVAEPVRERLQSRWLES